MIPKLWIVAFVISALVVAALAGAWVLLLKPKERFSFGYYVVIDQNESQTYRVLVPMPMEYSGESIERDFTRPTRNDMSAQVSLISTQYGPMIAIESNRSGSIVWDDIVIWHYSPFNVGIVQLSTDHWNSSTPDNVWINYDAENQGQPSIGVIGISVGWQPPSMEVPCDKLQGGSGLWGASFLRKGWVETRLCENVVT